VREDEAAQDGLSTPSIAGDNERIARALRSGVSHDAPLDRPFDPGALLSLAYRFNKRLRSTGGRRTDPDWTLSRRIPFKSSTWESLQRIAEILGEHGQSVAPGQLAGLLLEDSIARLEELDQAALETHESVQALQRTRAD
jgi:hypothetical protein